MTPPIDATSPVSSPSPPTAAELAFGDRLPLAIRYAHLLATDAVEFGLIGPREVPRLWDRHILNCAALSELIPQAVAGGGFSASDSASSGRSGLIPSESQSDAENPPGDSPLSSSSAHLVDVGSGAGLPGLVLAIARPELRIMLVEPMMRRVRFLQTAVSTLDLDNVSVMRARAEELVGTLRVDLIVARAVAPLPRLVHWTLPLLRSGGRLLAMKGASAESEVSDSAGELRRAGAQSIRILHCGTEFVTPPVTVVEIVHK